MFWTVEVGSPSSSVQVRTVKDSLGRAGAGAPRRSASNASCHDAAARNERSCQEDRKDASRQRADEGKRGIGLILATGPVRDQPPVTSPGRASYARRYPRSAAPGGGPGRNLEGR